MSVNCIRCVKQQRTGSDLRCDYCRTIAQQEAEIERLKGELRMATTEAECCRSERDASNSIATQGRREIERLRAADPGHGTMYELRYAGHREQAIEVGKLRGEIMELKAAATEYVEAISQVLKNPMDLVENTARMTAAGVRLTAAVDGKE